MLQERMFLEMRVYPGFTTSLKGNEWESSVLVMLLLLKNRPKYHEICSLDNNNFQYRVAEESP